jgi:hypothetical protein
MSEQPVVMVPAVHVPTQVCLVRTLGQFITVDVVDPLVVLDLLVLAVLVVLHQ